MAQARAAARQPVEKAAPRHIEREEVIERRPPPGAVVGLNRKGEKVWISGNESHSDPFHIPPHLIPHGWSWEWKNFSVLGQQDKHGMAELQRNHWEPVMTESIPGVFLPVGETGPVIVKEMILMERDLRFTHHALAVEKAKADAAVGVAATQHGLKPINDGVSVTDAAVRANTYVRRHQDSGADIPRPKHELEID